MPVPYPNEITPSDGSRRAPSGVDMALDHHGERAFQVSLEFSGGMDRMNPPHLLPQNVCRLLLNFYYPRENRAPVTRPGLVQYQTGAAADDKVTAIHIVQVAGTDTIVFSAVNAAGTNQDLFYLDGSKAKQTIATGIGTVGNLTPPSMVTFDNRLVLAMPGKALREWGLLTGGSPAKASGTIQVTAYGSITDGETLEVDGVTFTFRTERVQPLEIEISTSSNNDQASKIQAAFATDLSSVTATVLTDTVTVTAVRTGTAGNAITLADGTGGDVTLSGATLSGGVNGAALDSISTYEAPAAPTVLALDRNGRLVAAGDATYPDRVFFSAPGDALQWATGDYGGGEYFDVGAGEGSSIAALTPFLDELWVHKTGQNREIYRMFIADPDTSSWLVQGRPYEVTAAACNHLASTTAGGKHLALDKNFFRVFQGVDTYDEVGSQLDGAKVFDFLASIDPDECFMTVNPDEMYVLVVPEHGDTALAYHYGTGRWAVWQFQARTISAACYSEGLGFMLVGCDDGLIYKLDPDYASDDGVNFSCTIIGKTFGGEGMHRVIFKQALIDFKHTVGGTGSLMFVVNRDEDNLQKGFDFEVLSGQLLLAEATMALSPDAESLYFTTPAYGRIGDFVAGDASNLAPLITVVGALTIHNLNLRGAFYGRTNE